MQYKNFSTPWKERAKRWKGYSYPGRPSKRACVEYKKFVKECVGRKKTFQALVLGATPEVRDLLHELGAKVMIIDINLEMILAMTELVKHSTDDETIVRGDWTNMPFGNNQFDVVLGDLVLPNVPPHLHKKFLKEIQRVLKPQGCFITKHWLVPENYNKTFEEVLDMYEQMPAYKNMSTEMFNHLLAVIWDKKTKRCDISLIRKYMERYKKRNLWKHPSQKVSKMFEDTWNQWAPMDKVWAYYTEKETESVMRPFFYNPKKVTLGDCKLEELDKMVPLWSHKVIKK